MAKNHRSRAAADAEDLPGRAPLNTALGETGGMLHTVPPNGDNPAAADPPADDKYLCRTLPGQQKFAKAYLAGTAPGIQQRYAPDAQTSDVEGWVEDDETVERLMRWREEAPYG